MMKVPTIGRTVAKSAQRDRPAEGAQCNAGHCREKNWPAAEAFGGKAPCRCREHAEERAESEDHRHPVRKPHAAADRRKHGEEKRLRRGVDDECNSDDPATAGCVQLGHGGLPP